MSKAFLVLGAESTGTRLVTRVLVHYGCFGDFTHEQRLDSGLEIAAGNDFVWRRSMPHNADWPNPYRLVEKIKQFNYTPVVIITIRDMYATVNSQLNAGHVSTIAQGEENYVSAYERIFSFIAQSRITPHIITYGNFVKRPVQVMQKIMPHVAPVQLDFIISDQNAKYYEGAK